jgi:hypothetical protein
LDAGTNKRIKELTNLIAAEENHDAFTKLVAEINRILDDQKPLAYSFQPPTGTSAARENSASPAPDLKYGRRS